MSQPRKLKAYAGNVCRGMLMGGADIIPGVSGGTVALILGIYERLVTAISRFDIELLRLLRQRKWMAAAEHVDLGFLITLACGILTGIVVIGNLMHYLLEHHLPETLAAFFGLILASGIIVAKAIDDWSFSKGVLMLAGGSFAFWLVGLGADKNPIEGNAYLFVCGMVAICAMILPGISGAFILVILGRYKYVTGLVKSITSGLMEGRLDFESIFPLVIFAAGCGAGLLSFSKFLRWLLARFHNGTMAVLCGFLIGSLRRVWPFKIWPEGEVDIKQAYPNRLPDTFDGEAATALALAVAAMIFVLVLEWVSRRHEAKKVKAAA